jgi:hypothetical protein
MCNESWMRRRFDEAEVGRRLWDEFERTQPRTETETNDDELEVTLEEREATVTPAER